MASEIVHPMIEVSCATHQVISETSRVILTQHRETMLIQTTIDNSDLNGHTLANDIIMREPGYPPYAASIMDGYAINLRSLEGLCDSEETKRWTHRVRGKVFAGNIPMSSEKVDDDSLSPCYYVTTGAVIPQGCDCVIPFEEVKISEDGSRIAISSSYTTSANQWIRLPGSDIPAGSIVLPAGTVLDAISIGILLQTGVRSVAVIQPVSVGILSTGNELFDFADDWPTNDKDDWKIANGKIPDINKPVLMSLLGNFFCKTKVVDIGISRDDAIDKMTEVVRTALSKCEVLITTGGISTGESDILERVLVHELKGRLHFGRLNMKPGKPTTFVTVPTENGDRLVFAMPGNPASAIVCTHLLVRPCLELIYDSWKHLRNVGIGDINHKIKEIALNTLIQPEVNACLTCDVKLDFERPEYHRVALVKSENKLLQANSTGTFECFVWHINTGTIERIFEASRSDFCEYGFD
jgi:molybdenum cofactor synthesis domain-containing protein